MIPHTYRGAINLDYTGQNTNEYQRLVAALIQLGWIYVETSALIIETDNLSLVWQGVELVAKQTASKANCRHSHTISRRARTLAEFPSLRLAIIQTGSR